MSMDAWGPNDEYPDDPDFECKDCGHVFNAPPAFTRRSYLEYEGTCPNCGRENLGGGGFYG